MDYITSIRRVRPDEKEDRHCGDEDTDPIRRAPPKSGQCGEPVALYIREAARMEFTGNTSVNGWYRCKEHGRKRARELNLTVPKPEGE